MRKSKDSQFVAIGDQAILEAEAVDCDFESFVDGLKTIVSALQERLDMAKDELRSRGEE
jgi:hypothetical protein